MRTKRTARVLPVVGIWEAVVGNPRWKELYQRANVDIRSLPEYIVEERTKNWSCAEGKRFVDRMNRQFREHKCQMGDRTFRDILTTALASRTVQHEESKVDAQRGSAFSTCSIREAFDARAEERRVGKAGVRKCRMRGSRDN